jgi:hypothetical protein
MTDGIEGVVQDAMTVEGWRRAEECTEIANVAFGLPDNPTIVEVGAYMGRGTCVLAGARRLARRGGVVHCVDPFDCSGDEFSIPHYIRILETCGSNHLEKFFMHNIRKFELMDFVTIHRGRSSEVIKTWVDEIDFLILDGDHSVEGAKEAFENWTPFLKPGGILVLANSPVGKRTPGHDGNGRIVEAEFNTPNYTDIRQYGSTAMATKVI